MDDEKKIILAIAVYAAIVIMVFHSLEVSAQLNTSVTAVAANEEGADGHLAPEEVTDFLLKIADTRMMDAQEGLLAMGKGTNAQIREYGQMLIQDNCLLLEKIKKLASQRNIILPSTMSNRKIDIHQNLSKEKGQDFDERFIKTIIIDRERDIKLFKKAASYPDPEVSAFAQRYLPLMQSHLEKIKRVKLELNDE